MISLQQRADSTTAVRRVDGRVVRGTRGGEVPVARQWIVLHRVGPDRAGPIDSTRSGADGSFSMRYRPSGDTAAVYFVSTSYGGVAYFTAPLRAPIVRGDDARLTVFDTTSGPVAIKIGGRHLIVGNPLPDGRRPIGEVYDLENDSTVTAIARDSASPVWTAHIPDAAINFQLNRGGDLAPGAVSQRGTSVGLFAPLSPGIRQVAFTYDLPARAFPLSLPIERPTGVLEILVQEPQAHVTGARLRELAPVSTDGRTFRRYLAQDVAGNTVLNVDVPRIVTASRERVYGGVGIAVSLAMVVALVFALRRARPQPVVVRTRGERQSQTLARAIADLDAEFERAPRDESVRASYDARRAELKAQLADALAAERRGV
ncbi:MAG TPA: hypothetical protein VFJ20_11690 [Gemmatimonadaceae bacterium]|nr:hypothetical protein [Gemmatimonadaceae bacterium]